MKIVYDLLILLLIIIAISLFTFRLRSKLLALWKEVSIKEVIFHRLLLDTINMYYASKEQLQNDENKSHFSRLRKTRKKKVRYLLLQERQNVYLYLSDLFNEIDDMENDELAPLKKQFKDLQKARRIYNSRVLVYNQTISVFPTRFLAIKMNLKIKEYFG